MEALETLTVRLANGRLRRYRIAGKSEIEGCRASFDAANTRLRNQLRTERRWWDYLYQYPLPLALYGFWQIKDEISNADHWKMGHEVYIVSNGHYANRPIWLDLFQSSRPERHHLMSAEDHDAFRALPDMLRLYRGVSDPKFKRGMSWTTDEERAKWFANRWFANRSGQAGHVYTCEISKTSVLAYFLGRNEAEAVIDPRRVRLEECVGSSLSICGGAGTKDA